MTGTPSLLCLNDQTFSGTAPTCDAIDMTEDDSNSQSVNVKMNKSSGFDLSGQCVQCVVVRGAIECIVGGVCVDDVHQFVVVSADPAMLLTFILIMLFLLLLIGAIIAALIYVCCRFCKYVTRDARLIRQVSIHVSADVIAIEQVQPFVYCCRGREKETAVAPPVTRVKRVQHQTMGEVQLIFNSLLQYTYIIVLVCMYTIKINSYQLLYIYNSLMFLTVAAHAANPGYVAASSHY